MGFSFSIVLNGLGRVKMKRLPQVLYRNMSQHVTYVQVMYANGELNSEYVYVFENDFAALKQEEIVLKRMKQTLF
jgi:hypothetical protein